ncbi:MAG: hypothetical protein ACK5IC_10130 [Moheibacter sp.]
MKKIIYMSIFTSLFALIGCKSKEEKFLQENRVIYYGTKEFEDFEKNSIIKIDRAWEIQKMYSKEHHQIPKNWLFFVVNEDYVFNSVLSPKEKKSFLGGVWVNSKTGEAKFNRSKQRLKYKKAYNGDGDKFPF